MKLLEQYAVISGLKINYSKTIALKIGINETVKYDTGFGRDITWQTGGTFTLLGIKYNLDEEDFTKINYREKVDNFKKTLNAWNTRKLTIYGKVCIIKSLALPKLVHLFSALPNPPEDILKLL